MEGLDELALAEQGVAGEAGEELERARRGGLSAEAAFGVERQLVDLIASHRLAQLALDQGAAEQHDEVAEEEALDPRGALCPRRFGA